MIQGFFKINQSRIAKTLCVEKEVKGSNCGGCCQLKKELAHENTDEGNVPTEQKQSEIAYCTLSETGFLDNPKFIEDLVTIYYYDLQPLAVGVTSSVFYPPDFI